MDKIDLEILKILQEDSTISTGEVAERVGLSTTPCWRRIQMLEQSGYIVKRVALVDRTLVNVPLDVFVSLKTNNHEIDWLKTLGAVVRDLPEIVEVYRMSGDVDYLMRIVVPDMAAYDALYKTLITRLKLSDVSSSFAMERIKYTTAVPLSFAHATGGTRVKKSR